MSTLTTAFADIPLRARPQPPRLKVVAVDGALFYFDGDLYEFERIEAD